MAEVSQFLEDCKINATVSVGRQQDVVSQMVAVCGKSVDPAFAGMCLRPQELNAKSETMLLSACETIRLYEAGP